MLTKFILQIWNISLNFILQLLGLFVCFDGVNYPLQTGDNNNIHPFIPEPNLVYMTIILQEESKMYPWTPEPNSGGFNPLQEKLVFAYLLNVGCIN